ncbi:MAG: exodeoxyribonuclease VII small subunit [Chloroflexota bacterium]|nr:exodeoxyribonuclease VII small subunit [Chloroflexota bacterium]
MSAVEQPGTVAALSFEEAYDRLEDVLSRLQMGNMTLDDSLMAFEEGMALAAHCQALLDAAELRVEQLERAAPADDADDEPPF